MMIRLVCAASTLGLLTRETKAQGQQLWLDYQVDYPFANQYLFEVTTSYQTNAWSSNDWRNYSITPTFEWQRFEFLDFLFNVPIAYTVQTEDFNSFELDPSVGVRYHITQNKRITSRLIFKLEERVFRDIEQDEWETSNRMRLKGEILISLNGPNLFQDNLWWTILDYEEFFVTDQQVDERFANRRRGRLGLGYRLDYRNRFELIYTLQSSRDEIGGDYSRLDNVLQLRYKMFLNPSKPKVPSSTDN
ncbi:DUF2490 domain-containing protein [Chryseolinea sp. T2]|uniref:DUF2490 domain-containing protein n=1 Tax=Chryseolinea sp. T2 TaxID=3129255 RepID=UPI0030789DD6